jgi:hypothetical protein
MTSERVRTFLGVWAPIILGGLVIAFALNFILRTSETPDRWPEDLSWDAWRAACAGGLIFIGVLLGLSTLGRYRKTKEARAAPPQAGGPRAPPNP